jgi:glycosidase
VPPAASTIALDAVSRPPSVEVRARPDATFDCIFAYQPASPVGRVNLAGDFNGWNTTATPMARGDDGVWRASATLQPGARLYKFVVDGDRWMPDPRNPEGEPDGHGGSNSVLRLGPEANLRGATAKRGDGVVEGAGISHVPQRAQSVQWLPDGRLLVRVRTLAGDVERVQLAMRGSAAMGMRHIGDEDGFSWWEVPVAMPPRATEYTFIFSDGANSVRDPRVYSLDPSERPDFRTPDWAKDAIWYQIMPDRFRSGSRENDPDQVRPWTSEWYTPSPWEGADGQSFYKWFVFSRLYGGDLQGLREKIGYLKDLGINAIYFNPVFQAPSHHKYNATNFLHIDEHFGTRGDYAKAEAVEDLRDPKTWTWTPTDQLFLQFLKECKAAGIRVIVDGVFNHVGTSHPAFRDVKERGQASPYADWFSVRSWEPFEYDGWAGFGELPVFRKTDRGFASEAVKKHIFDVTRRWMDPNGDGDPSDGIDGWRLDVPNEVPMPFWEEWRALVKSINPNAYIVGEIWRRADDWLDGRTFDAVMNYPFAEGMIRWVGDRERKITASELDRRLAELRRAYPSEATYVLQNLVDSHDTDRLVSKLKNPDREYDRGNREQEEGVVYDASKPGPEEYRKARLIALAQMTYVGAPMIYYGDEAGMWGSDDPTNRKPMLWPDLEPYEKPQDNRFMPEQHEHYQRAIALRRAHPALRTGSFETVLCDDAQDVWIFLRETPDERILVALNASGTEARIDLTTAPESRLGGRWRSVWGGEGASVGDAEFPRISVPACDGRVWVQER